MSPSRNRAARVSTTHGPGAPDPSPGDPDHALGRSDFSPLHDAERMGHLQRVAEPALRVSPLDDPRRVARNRSARISRPATSHSNASTAIRRAHYTHRLSWHSIFWASRSLRNGALRCGCGYPPSLVSRVPRISTQFPSPTPIQAATGKTKVTTGFQGRNTCLFNSVAHANDVRLSSLNSFVSTTSEIE
jgi:hypothetical protein